MEARSLILSASEYPKVSAYDLLCAAEQGFVGIDHRLLHALVDDPEKTVPGIVRFAEEERPDAREDLSDDLVQIFRHLRTPLAVPFLIEYFREHHDDAPLELISAFQAIGAPAVEPLLAFYEKVKTEDSSDAAFLLGSLGVRDPRILKALVERLEFDPIDAGHCLAAYGDPVAIPAVREAIERVKSEEWMVRSLQFCIEELENGRKTEEEEFDIWALYPHETDPRFDLLTEKETELFLKSDDADNRYAAVAVLSEMETPRRLWDKLLKMAREDPDPRVRGQSWQALIDGWDRGDIRKAMQAVVADESASADERTGALRSLAAREGEKPEIQKWMRQFYEDPETRAAAMQAMAISEDPGFADIFRERLGDEDPDVSAQAMLGIAMLGLESEAPRLVPYFQDEDLRPDALAAYAMCAPCELTRTGLQELYARIDELAGELSEEEDESVKGALNTRAGRGGADVPFGPEGEALLEDEHEAAVEKAGRNDPCPCGSGKKYKKCCGAA